MSHSQDLAHARRSSQIWPGRVAELTGAFSAPGQRTRVLVHIIQ